MFGSFIDDVCPRERDAPTVRPLPYRQCVCGGLNVIHLVAKFDTYTAHSFSCGDCGRPA